MTTLKTIRFFFLIILTTVCVPVFAQQASASSETSVSTHSDRNVTRWRASNGGTSFNIEMRGKMEITDDDKDVKSMSDDGYLEISKTVFGSKRVIVIESLGGGKLKRQYYEGRTEINWEPAGRQWLSEIMPEVVRSTTIGAEARVNRIFAKGGTDAVLTEIKNMSSDYVKSHYGKLLLSKNIPTGEIKDVINTLASEVNSDYYLSELLKNNIGKLLATPESADAFFSASNKISSDYYKSVLLKEALNKYSASPAQVKTILAAASEMSSAYYLSVVLTSLLENQDVKDESLTEMINVSKKIDSDYYRMQVIVKALEKPNLPKVALKYAVEAAATINSDYYQSAVYTTMSDKAQLDQDIQVQVITQISTSVNSDYYSASALTSMLEHQKLSDDSFRQLVAAAGKINSAHYATQILSEAGERNLTRTQLLDVIKAAENIDSDHYLTTVLLKIADKVKASDSTVKDAYRQAAKKIGSETYYGRAVKAID